MDTKRIRELCDEYNLSINALEKKANIGRNSVARWEEHPPALEKVVSVADALETSVDYLCGRTDDKGLSNAENQILIEYRALSKENKELLEKYILFLVTFNKDGNENA